MNSEILYRGYRIVPHASGDRVLWVAVIEPTGDLPPVAGWGDGATRDQAVERAIRFVDEAADRHRAMEQAKN
jgi:hypothetical protein